MSNMILDSVEFIPVMQQQFNDGLTVQLVVTGNSMLPFLVHRRDSVVLTKYNGNAKKGDILLFKRIDGKCVLHRVKTIDNDGLYFIGDGQINTEGPIDESAVLAKCCSVIRKGKLINESSFTWLFFKYIWLNIVKLRLPIIRFVSKFK